MLGSFLSSYPTGSMQTELVQIYNGKYIVKASLQVEGVTRATAMAADETLETAEDSAKQRAIAFFSGGETVHNSGLLPSVTANPKDAQTQQYNIPVQPNTSQNISIDTSQNHQESVNSHATSVEIPQEAPSSDAIPTNNLQENAFNNTDVPKLSTQPVEEVAPPAKSKTKVDKTKTITQDVSQFAEADTKRDLQAPSNITSLNQIPVKPPEPLFDTYEDFAATTPKEPLNNVPDSFSIPAPSNVTPFTGRNYNPPEEIELPPVDITPTTSTTNKRKKKEATDQSDDIAKISIEMQRLNWTTEQGRDYLVKQYGKRSRHLLSPEELRDFRQYLESQSTPEDPLAFDPIAGF
jgi:hypothetical protein